MKLISLVRIAAILFLLVTPVIAASPLPVSAGRAQTSARCALTWTKMTAPIPPDGEDILWSVAANSPEDVWAVGYNSIDYTVPTQTLIEHWDGARWSVVPSPNVGTHDNVLYDVTVLAHDDAWAVGSAGAIGQARTLILHWDGVQWTVIPSPKGSSGDESLHSIAAAASNDIWAVGHSSGSALILHWDGVTWQSVASPTSGAWVRVLARATDDVWALSEDSENLAVILHWKGDEWQVVSSFTRDFDPPPSGHVETVSDFYIGGPNDIWVMGEDHFYLGTSSGRHWHWDGASWTESGALALSRKIAGVQADNLWSIGWGPNAEPPLTENWDGASWTTYDMTPQVGLASLVGLTAVSNQEFWIVGTDRQETSAGAAFIAHGTLPCV